MGTLYKEPPSIIQDLKVTLQYSSIVFPLEEIERRSMFLSNIDQVLNFNVETIHFFPANPDLPPEIVAEKIKTALRKVLVPYDFLAGRLMLNPQKGRLEIDCNAAGVGFAVATSEVSLDEIGDLVYPNPAFMQLIMRNPDNLDPDNQLLCFVQVTLFKCGSFTLGISTNHVTFDGISFKHFLDNLASLAGDKPLAVTPCNNRQLLAARSPPCVMFPHPELVNFEIPPATTLFEAKPEDLEFNIFRLSSKNISDLKEKAKLGLNKNGSNTRIMSSFNVVTAHVWRCKALSGDIKGNQEKTSTLLYAVDIRARLCPPLPSSYTGNSVLAAYACTKIGEIENASFSYLVEMVSEGATRMTDEYIRSAIDCGEMSKRFPHGDLLISSWWKLGFSNVDYPWGRPKYSCPVVRHRKNIIVFFPDIEGASFDNGVNILVALPFKEMEKFQALFNNSPA
ncbi:fatty alcohol:caffeoyl-CoA acyltransferase [Telopea speciosissima]|uniref:fatty alcohol:caffeoyl-CoA acyltransferase n=1 Tax=Telopea speciosissima TaxID=54955 RepID=UPI001CC7CBCE|nr:fatty alcohol:caffeoyl-CoA acyltransferase [Telopea speciosissima]XP_043687280.1 fatty alcohol:caffeoyl-CoA acyltransferase [Telopea speciosissima]XP_043687281.1 fatty alcohol:caffeoyl-CoA acyltransferase [Telopea speciosissima]XP_043687282.1 fatty alcohol:caffeoyl-CoA acyltransferase [Telopea speciosissima]